MSSSSSGSSTGSGACQPYDADIALCQGNGGRVDYNRCTCVPADGSQGSCDFTSMQLYSWFCGGLGVDPATCFCGTGQGGGSSSSSGMGGSSSSGASSSSSRMGGCTNTCMWANDGQCDDGGAGATTNLCTYATDCTDCGTRP